MKTNNILIFFFTITCLCTSCAHKSGHGTNNAKGTQHSEQIISTNGVTNTTVTISSDNRNKNKIEGPEVFTLYNTAVFMVFSKHSKKCTFYTLRFGCSFAAVNTIKPQLL